MMDFATIAFHAISCLLAVLASVLLLWVSQERRHSDRLLAFILIIFALQNLVFLLLFTKLMLSVPWFLRVMAPTTFLIGPLTYLYFRAVLKDETTFRRQDWLLLIPAILTLINFIPYYLLPQQEKIEYVNRNFYERHQAQDPGMGFLPSTLYYLIRICWSGIFVYLCFRLIRKFRKENNGETLARNRILLKWLYSFLGMLTAIWLVTIFRLFIPTLRNSRVSLADMMLGATSLYMCFQLFLRPHILYGVYQPLPEIVVKPEMAIGEGTPTAQSLPGTGSMGRDMDTPSPVPAERFADLAEKLRYKNLVETHFRDGQVFLKRNYSLDHLVKDTNIPRYTLSAFINREYGMGFREFLNRHRIDYLTAHIGNPQWENYTFEAMAMESGFANRITFIKNLKQITGKTPTEYFKDHLSIKGPSEVEILTG